MVTQPSRIRSLGAKSVKLLLHHLGFTVRRLRALRANFIVTFHIVPPNDSAYFEETIRFLAHNFRLVQVG